jgi:hypothetical protein
MQCVGGDALTIWKFDSLDELLLCCMLHTTTGVCWSLSIWSLPQLVLSSSFALSKLGVSLCPKDYMCEDHPQTNEIHLFCMMWRRSFSHVTIVRNWPLHMGSSEFSKPPGAPLHIFKNLWVCHDCHTSTKLIAKVAGRENISSFWGWHLFLQRFLVIPTVHLMHRLSVMGVPIVNSFRICRMKGTCAPEYMMHICRKYYWSIWFLWGCTIRSRHLKLSECQRRETPFIRPGKVMRIATGYQLDSKVMHTKLEFSTLW